MFKRFRFLVFSANLVAVLFISTLILSKSEPVEACPQPAPRTLLELYLESDLIFVADITDEKDGKVLIDDKNYYRLEIIRNLKISPVLKGKPPTNQKIVPKSQVNLSSPKPNKITMLKRKNQQNPNKKLRS